MRLFGICCLTALGLTGAPPSPSRTAALKIDSIARGHVPPGARVFLSPPEVNAFMRDEANVYLRDGVKNVRLDLHSDRATGFATVDFVRLRQHATGEAPGWVMRNLFAGERPVSVTARLASQHGRARVDIERVEVAGLPVSGRTLDFLIDNCVKPMFPMARVSEWFELGYRVDRLTLNSGGLTIAIQK